MPDAARNHAPAAGAGNLTLIDARLSYRLSRYKCLTGRDELISETLNGHEAGNGGDSQGRS